MVLTVKMTILAWTYCIEPAQFILETQHAVTALFRFAESLSSAVMRLQHCQPTKISSKQVGIPPKMLRQQIFWGAKRSEAPPKIECPKMATLCNLEALLIPAFIPRRP